MSFRKAAGFVLIVLSAAACGLQLSPSKDPWFAQHYYIMQDFERTAYKAFSPAAKLEFQKLFWGTRPSIVKQEFDKRMSFIVENFKTENSRQPWNTDRARVYLLNGNPVHIEKTVNDAWAMKVIPGSGQSGSIDERTGEDVGAATHIVWTYRYDQFLVNYVFTFSKPNSWVINPATFKENRYIGALEVQNKTQTYSISDEKKYKEQLESLKSIKEEKK